MTWHETADVEQYLAAAGDLLLPDPARHTIALTAVENTRAHPDGTRFAWWTEPTGEVTGAVSCTPPYPVLLAVVPDHAVSSLTDLWLREGGEVNGPTALAVQVAAVAAQRHGGTVRLHHAERLFRLGDLLVPDVPGRPRLATRADEALLLAYYTGFVDECRLPAVRLEENVRDRLSFGGMLLWEDDGRPVAMAGHTR
ncbi:MAG: hypothetical protein WCD35_13245, partial [Mycobacteriales bacterium]